MNTAVNTIIIKWHTVTTMNDALNISNTCFVYSWDMVPMRPVTNADYVVIGIFV
jgi:hypothetical protein